MNPHNPNNLDSNCVFVTISKLLDKPYQTLIQELGWMDAEPGSDMSISIDTLKSMLWKIRQMYHAHVQFHMVPHGNTLTSRELCNDKCIEWKVNRVGFLYNLPSGEGHTICFENRNGGFHFLDWQNMQEVTPDPPNPAVIISVVAPQ